MGTEQKKNNKSLFAVAVADDDVASPSAKRTKSKRKVSLSDEDDESPFHGTLFAMGIRRDPDSNDAATSTGTESKRKAGLFDADGDVDFSFLDREDDEFKGTLFAMRSRASNSNAAAAASSGTKSKTKVSLFDLPEGTHFAMRSRPCPWRFERQSSATSSDNEASLSAKLSRASINEAAAAANPSINLANGRPYSARYQKLLKRRRKLPVWQQKGEFFYALRNNQVVILVGETGSGKTTQIPQFVLEAVCICDQTMVACTQPWRVAAMSASRRVAEEMDVTLGEEVGYSVRFDHCCSRKTVLKYLTDGTLLREALTDPRLEKYKVIILDEVHERTWATDVLLGLLRKCLKYRPDLKLVIMGATIEAGKFQAYFSGAPLMKVPGRLHPVEIIYTQEPERDYLEAAITKVVEIHESQPGGDILVFLTGEEEIEEACWRINKEIDSLGNQVGPVEVVPLYSTLPLAMQLKVFEPGPTPFRKGGFPGRKIVLSTNIAQSSLTIDGIVYVIDPGFFKMKVYHPSTRVESLGVSLISKASAHQRTGRAGRTQPGKCYRLYTKKSFNEDFQQHTIPEILRSNLAYMVLILKKLGIKSFAHFGFLDPPTLESRMRALEVLDQLGAIDHLGDLTLLGEMMSEFPLDPQMSKMLVTSPNYNCSSEILSISAMLSAPSCFRRPRESQKLAAMAKAQFAHDDGDHLTLLNVYQEYKRNNKDPEWCYGNFINAGALEYANKVRKQLVRIMRRLNLKICSTNSGGRAYYVNIRKAVLAGYFMQVAHLEVDTRHYLTVKDDQAVRLLPLNCMHPKPEWVMYTECISTSRNKKFIRRVMGIRGKWLIDIAPRYYKLSTFPSGDAKCALKMLYKREEMSCK